MRGTEDSDSEGRIPTPKMLFMPTTSKRHHLDRTTPAVGGALLTSPPKHSPRDNDSSDSGVGRANPRFSHSAPVPIAVQAEFPSKVRCTCGAEENTSSEYESNSQGGSYNQGKSHTYTHSNHPVRKEPTKQVARKDVLAEMAAKRRGDTMRKPVSTAKSGKTTAQVTYSVLYSMYIAWCWVLYYMALVLLVKFIILYI